MGFYFAAALRLYTAPKMGFAPTNTNRVLALRLLGLVYLVATIVNISHTGGGHRFTWWNALIFSLFCLSGGTKGIRGIAVLTSTVVLFGVIGMSAGQCSLFEEAFDDMGFAGYVAGTFAVHYVPWLVITCTVLFGPSAHDADRGLIGPGAIIVCIRLCRFVRRRAR